MYRLDINQAELIKFKRNVRNIRERFLFILSGVIPEFGAYMPYSLFQEEGRSGWSRDSGSSPRHQYYPHILPAITKNAAYITRELSRRLYPVMLQAMNGANVQTMRAEIRKSWEEVLNAKPRLDAIAGAPEEYGFHKSTIRGYGNERTEGSIRQQQMKLMREREFTSRFRDTARTKQIQSRLQRNIGGR